MRGECVVTALLQTQPPSKRAGSRAGAQDVPGRKGRRGERVLWCLLAAAAALFLLNVIYPALSGKRSGFLLGVSQVMPVLLVAGHASLSKGWARGVFFASTCFFLGLLAEVLGVRYGFLFGGHYTYLDVDVAYGGVPLIIPVFWVIFIYICYSMVNTFLLFLGRKKPTLERGGVLPLALLIALDGVLVVIIDVIMDPIMVKAGKWEWAGGGPYYGVPLGNFLGWFILACLASGSFRILECLRPRPEPEFERRFHLVPAIGYGAALFGFIAYSINIDMLAILPVALLLMGPVLIANLMLYSGTGGKRPAGGRPFGKPCAAGS
jgi:uncharacterized membrane protein